MRIFLIALVFSFLLAAAVNLAHAADSTNSSIPSTNITTNPILQTSPAGTASRTATLKNKLNTFRDKRKAALVEQINTTLINVNQKRSMEMMKHIETLDSIISRLETRINSVTDKDTTSTKNAVASAKTAIDTARAAVEAQSTKDYTVSITSETKVRTDVLKARESLYNDLVADHQLIVAARQAVAAAISTTAQLGGIKNGQ